MITAASKTLRQAIQTLILGLGAYLAIRREITLGVVIAGSILLGRALAPLDLLINTWRGFISARDAYQRLDRLLAALPERAARMALRGRMARSFLIMQSSRRLGVHQMILHLPEGYDTGWPTMPCRPVSGNASGLRVRPTTTFMASMDKAHAMVRRQLTRREVCLGKAFPDFQSIIVAHSFQTMVVYS